MYFRYGFGDKRRTVRLWGFLYRLPCAPSHTKASTSATPGNLASVPVVNSVLQRPFESSTDSGGCIRGLTINRQGLQHNGPGRFL